MSEGFTQEQVFVILTNLGVDVTCGACMSIAFMGSAPGYTHTCKAIDEDDDDKYCFGPMNTDEVTHDK